MSNSTSIVTVCVEGMRSRRTKNNTKRILLLHSVAQAIIQSRWQQVDAIVLPGGYFYRDESIGHLAQDDRIATIEKEAFAGTALEAVRTLQSTYPGIQIIVGVDTAPARQDEHGDEYCMAWNADGISGIGRKVFPVDGRRSSKRVVPSYVSDFTDRRRFIMLGNGRRAVLCACYDMFGIRRTREQLGARIGQIRFLYDGKRRWERGEAGFRSVRDAAIDGWLAMLDEQNADIALAAIHEFEWAGLDGFWQRHGIAGASAAMNGRPAIGASHFFELPSPSSTSTLAAFRVDPSHLTDGLHRRAHRYLATDCLIAPSDYDTALLRHFSF